MLSMVTLGALRAGEVLGLQWGYIDFNRDQRIKGEADDEECQQPRVHQRIIGRIIMDVYSANRAYRLSCGVRSLSAVRSFLRMTLSAAPARR